MKSLLSLSFTLFFAGTAVGQTTNGMLASGDTQRGEGIYYDATTLQIDKPSSFTVRMESQAFDTYLILRSPSGVESTNDDFEGQTVSQIDMLATETGTWTVWATAYGTGMEGDYSLTVTRGAEVEIETLEGRLDHRDPIALKGEYFDTIVRDLPGDIQFIFELVSLGYDGYLVITTPSGEVQRNDDSGSTRLSRIGPLSAPAGKWTIQVTSATAGEQGAYDLNIVRLKPAKK